MAAEKKTKQIKQLFVQDLAQVQGGKAQSVTMPCPQWTTLACNEEANGCSGC
ncbi:MAG TPA: hypothetical protein VE153_23140 [Myxococcus sp.]|nr:hypothetical protein [Myxococcus sp.]